MANTVYVLTYADWHGDGIFGAYATYGEAFDHVIHAFAWMSYCYGDLGSLLPLKTMKSIDGASFIDHGRRVYIKSLVVGECTIPWYADSGYPSNQSGGSRSGSGKEGI